MSDLNDLVEPLHAVTMAGKLPWSVDSESLVSTRQSTNLLEIISANVSSLRFIVKNKDGVPLDEKRYSTESPRGNLLGEIVRKVRRDALGVDKAIADIRNALIKL